MNKCGAVRLGRTQMDDVACSKTFDPDNHETDESGKRIHDYTVKHTPDGGWEDDE